MARCEGCTKPYCEACRKVADFSDDIVLEADKLVKKGDQYINVPAGSIIRIFHQSFNYHSVYGDGYVCRKRPDEEIIAYATPPLPPPKVEESPMSVATIEDAPVVALVLA